MSYVSILLVHEALA